MTDTQKVLILLSDIDPIFSRVCKNKFGQLEGWDPVITSSFEDAKQRIVEAKPSLILTEIILNNGNGYDLLSFIRSSEDPELAATPVIILTELSQEEERTKAIDLGATDYMVKSEVSLNDVIDRLKLLVG